MMRKLILLIFCVSLGLAGGVACDRSGTGTESGEEEEEHAVVESGTYEGQIAEVNADEREIYVNVDDKELELYFTDETQLLQGGETVSFDTLEKGQQVRVEVEKVGQRLDPLKVEILSGS